MQKTNEHIITKCNHCGNACEEEIITKDNTLNFCCKGCELVYELLHENGLASFYEVEESAGISLKNSKSTDWDYLDNENFSHQFILFKNDKITKISLHLPAIHCSACIWLLEKLYRLNTAIISSNIDFSRKEATVTYNHQHLKLSEIVALLHSIGYTPDLQNGEKARKPYRKLLFQIGIAGFCFGNIMLFSLPEYFGAPLFKDSGVEDIFPYLIALLGLPVFFYSAQDYFKSSWAALRQKSVNMDVPIAMGIVTLLLYSYWEIFTLSGQGYIDSLAALVFFLLLGKLYQQKTYDHLRFDRDYKSYFPLTAQLTHGESSKSVPLADLQIGDSIWVKNEEIVPADSILLEGDAQIDYSFVTGESVTVRHKAGQTVYAGGKQCGAAIKLKVSKKASQSYLTQLWNNEAFTGEKELYFESLANSISKYFTPAIILIAVFSALYWYNTGHTEYALKAFTSVLIIACPCALALTSPVTLGSAIRIMGKYRFYVKNASVIEALAKTDTIIFDKTGTLTQAHASSIHYHGQSLGMVEKQLIGKLLTQSIHPLSKEVAAFLPHAESLHIADYKEISGQGLQASVSGRVIKAGKHSFVKTDQSTSKEQIEGSNVHISIDNKYMGYFSLQQPYREGMVDMIRSMKGDYRMHLLSGDNENERADFEQIFGEGSQLHFNQSPEDKLKYIGCLQEEGRITTMLGDGLNDAGALKKSNIGIAVTENTSFFSPACDVIMEGSVLSLFKQFVAFARKSKRVIVIGFFISLLYNIVGLSIAVQALLSPVIAAILMPISSFSVVLWAILGTNMAENTSLKNGKKPSKK